MQRRRLGCLHSIWRRQADTPTVLLILATHTEKGLTFRCQCHYWNTSNPSNMTSLLPTLKSLIEQRLCVAAEEIFVMVERVVTEYEQLQQHFTAASKQHMMMEHQRSLLDTKQHRTAPNTALKPTGQCLQLFSTLFIQQTYL